MLCRAYYIIGVDPERSDRPVVPDTGDGIDVGAVHPDDLPLAQLRARFPVPFGRPERRYVCLHGSVEDVWRRAAELGEWLNKEGGGEKSKLVVVLGTVDNRAHRKDNPC